ncbi:MAG TPA: pyridoxamine 5'-phosphate oxidase family protein, partial [Acidimicrobiales bacterium]|nr:pyridoxamine 5'-phosphate oxidase family protein [Acidimicrobiales bacterium]
MAALDDIKAAAVALSPLAHFATVGDDGRPDVSPVHPAWEGDTLWIMSGGSSVKACNIAANASVAMHWQVTEAG